MPEKVSITKLRKKEGRGIFLTIMLVVYGIGVVLVIGKLLDSLFSIEAPPPPFIQALLLVIALLSLCIFIGIYKWKKIAVYIYCAWQVLGIIIDIIAPLLFKKSYLTFQSYLNHYYYYYGPPHNIWGGAFIIFLYFWAIKRKWHLFS